MLYQIKFNRSVAIDFEDGWRCFKSKEELIYHELHNTGMKDIPSLFNWTCPLMDMKTGAYFLWAHFTSVLSQAEVEQIFHRALTVGLKGTFEIKCLQKEFVQMVVRN